MATACAALSALEQAFASLERGLQTRSARRLTFGRAGPEDWREVTGPEAASNTR